MPLVKCNEHGSQRGFLVSRELSQAMMETNTRVPAVAITLQIGGGKTLCYVTPGFAKQHGLDPNEPIELVSEESQPWTSSLTGYCEKCFTERVKLEGETTG